MGEREYQLMFQKRSSGINPRKILNFILHWKPYE